MLQLSNCDVCQRMNRKLTTGVPELHPIPVKAPWYMVGIDFIGPLSPVAKDGSQYILTISDYFTKWVEALPAMDKMASTVAGLLFKVSILSNVTASSIFSPNHIFYRCSCEWDSPEFCSQTMAVSSAMSSMTN